MVRVGTLLDQPIKIYSTDSAVFDDPLVKQVCDHARIVDGPLLVELERAAAETVQRPERGAWNRGTFLKWAVFEEQETEQALFLDADMLCLAPAEELLDLHPEAQWLWAPQVQRQTASAEDLQKRIDGTFPSTRVNSGVMLMRGRVLTEAFRRELLDFAFASAADAPVNEQGHMSSYLKLHPEMHRRLSLRFNFQEGYLNGLAPEDQAALAAQAVFLHYAGPGAKPWSAERSTLRPTQLIWFDA